MGKSKDLATGETRFVNTAGDTMTGNLGVKATLKTTHADADVVQFGGTGYLANWEDAETYLAENLYVNSSGGYRYLTNSHASLYSQTTGKHQFKVASSGSADGTPTLTTGLEIDNSGIVTNPNQPAFNATQGTSINISGTVTLTYNSVRSNASNSFNGSTGIFTAPVAGQYIFTHKALYYPFSTTEYLDFYSYVNSSIRNRYEQTGNAGEHTQVNYAEVVYLNANDTFKIVCSNRNIGAFTMYGAENHFSGRLLG